MICDYCGKEAKLVTGDLVYPHRPDLSHKMFYRCSPCDAHVGCHPGTTNPLGRLANKKLRTARMHAHKAFDPLWKNGSRARRNAYKWLAKELNIHVSSCHIGMFNYNQCMNVILICRGKK